MVSSTTSCCATEWTSTRRQCLPSSASRLSSSYRAPCFLIDVDILNDWADLGLGLADQEITHDQRIDPTVGEVI